MAISEKRLFQIAFGLTALVPLAMGLGGVFIGAKLLGVDAPPHDLSSHYGYLSGLLVALWLGFLTCLPRIEQNGRRFRLLTAIVVIGGAARLYAVFAYGHPTWPHIVALVGELGVVPFFALWQWRIARRASASNAAPKEHVKR